MTASRATDAMHNGPRRRGPSLVEVMERFGVPPGALVVLTAMLTAFGLPLEGAALLLGVDQIMDMGRTGVNVLGNCLAAVVVAPWEGVFDDGLLGAAPRAGVS